MADFRQTAVETLLAKDSGEGLALLVKHLRHGHLADMVASMIESGALVYDAQRKPGRPPADHSEVGFWILARVDGGEKREAALAAAVERFNVKRTVAADALADARSYRHVVDQIRKDERSE
jgi:hypothetical protein